MNPNSKFIIQLKDKEYYSNWAKHKNHRGKQFRAKLKGNVKRANTN